jgi:hypothetical protein
MGPLSSSIPAPIAISVTMDTSEPAAVGIDTAPAAQDSGPSTAAPTPAPSDPGADACPELPAAVPLDAPADGDSAVWLPGPTPARWSLRQGASLWAYPCLKRVGAP